MSMEQKEYIEFFYKKIAERIKSKRKELNLTQEKLAVKINIDTKIISNAEQNRRTSKNRYLLSETILIELLKIFNVSRKELLFGNDNEQIQLTECILENYKSSIDVDIKKHNDNNVTSEKPLNDAGSLFDRLKEMCDIDSKKIYNANKKEINNKMSECYNRIANYELKKIEKYMNTFIECDLKDCIEKVYLEGIETKREEMKTEFTMLFSEHRKETENKISETYDSLKNYFENQDKKMENLFKMYQELTKKIEKLFEMYQELTKDKDK